MGSLVSPTGFRMGVRGTTSRLGLNYSSSNYVFSVMKDLRLFSFLIRFFWRSRYFRYKGFFFSHFLFLFSKGFSYLLLYIFNPDIFFLSKRYYFFFSFLRFKLRNCLFGVKFLWRNGRVLRLRRLLFRPFHLV